MTRLRQGASGIQRSCICTWPENSLFLFVCKISCTALLMSILPCNILTSQRIKYKVNEQPKLVRLIPIQKVLSPIKWLRYPLPEVIHEIYKKQSLGTSYDKKTSDELCDMNS